MKKSNKIKNIKKIIKLTKEVDLVSDSVDKITKNVGLPSDIGDKIKTAVFNKSNMKLLEDRIVDFYDGIFSEEEVQGLVDFYTSDIGAKLLDNHAKIIIGILDIREQWSQEILADAVGPVTDIINDYISSKSGMTVEELNKNINQQIIPEDDISIKIERNMDLIMKFIEDNGWDKDSLTNDQKRVITEMVQKL